MDATAGRRLWYWVSEIMREGREREEKSVASQTKKKRYALAPLPPARDSVRGKSDTTRRSFFFDEFVAVVLHRIE